MLEHVQAGLETGILVSGLFKGFLAVLSVLNALTSRGRSQSHAEHALFSFLFVILAGVAKTFLKFLV